MWIMHPLLSFNWRNWRKKRLILV